VAYQRIRGDQFHVALPSTALPFHPSFAQQVQPSILLFPHRAKSKLDGSNVLKLAFCPLDENIGVQSVVSNAV